MAKGFVFQNAASLQPLLHLKPGWVRCWLRMAIERNMPPACPARPLGLYLAERVWQRQSAFLTCWREQDENTP